MFIRNAWYVAALANEVGREKLLARTLLGERVVMYRKSDGAPVALHDRCPHRFVPLHRGKLNGDAIQCSYHGLEFGASGACTHNPHNAGVISRNMHVKTYPVVERNTMIWIWLGDPQLADPDKIRQFEIFTDTERYTTVTGYIHVAANYQLLNDNLLNLSHAQYLHPLFQNGVSPELEKTHQESGQNGDSLWSRVAKYDVKPHPFEAMFTDLERVDSFLNTTWYSPSITYLDIGAQPVGVPRGPETFETPALHLLTPETERSSHYFWAMSRNLRLDDKEFSENLWLATNSTFALEDKPLIESQQAEMENNDLSTLKPMLLPIDSLAMRARWAIKSLLKAEQESQTGTKTDAI